MSAELILANIVKERVQTQPDLDVVTIVDIDERGEFVDTVRTYRQLWNNGQAIATSLIDAGMQLEDRFALFMHNEADFVDAMVGSSIAGTVFVPIDPRSRGRKLSYMLGSTECRGVIASDLCLSMLSEILDDLPRLEWIWLVGEGDVPGLSEGSRVDIKRIADVLVNDSPELAVMVSDDQRPMQMLFTSGTTGDPKAILSPYSRMGTAVMAFGLFGLNSSDRPYTGLSLTHANAQLLTLGSSLYAGMRCVISKKFTKSRLWDITRAYGCTVFNLLGGMTNAIYSEPPSEHDADNPVRLVISAGMPKEIWASFRDRFGIEIYEFYGAAEGGFTANPPNIGPVGSIGKPPPSMVAKIVDEWGIECPPGEAGQIVFQNADGSAPIVEYYKNTEATEKKVVDGWLQMGDIGYMDEEGWMYFLFRKGGGIRKNGDFISQGVLEKELAELDAVADVFVYGVPTADSAPGEKDIVAAIVPGDRSAFSAEDLFAHCREKLEASHVPDYIHLVANIPKTASEKPQERFLVEDFRSGDATIFARTSA